MTTSDKLKEMTKRIYGLMNPAFVSDRKKDLDGISDLLTELLEQHKEMICTQCHEQHKASVFPDRPNPRDVNPYDIKAVHRARNPRKRT